MFGLLSHTKIKIKTKLNFNCRGKTLKQREKMVKQIQEVKMSI